MRTRRFPFFGKLKSWKVGWLDSSLLQYKQIGHATTSRALLSSSCFRLHSKRLYTVVVLMRFRVFRFACLEHSQVSGWVFGENGGRMQSRFAIWSQQADLVKGWGLSVISYQGLWLGRWQTRGGKKVKKKSKKVGNPRSTAATMKCRMRLFRNRKWGGCSVGPACVASPRCRWPAWEPRGSWWPWGEKKK